MGSGGGTQREERKGEREKQWERERKREREAERQKLSGLGPGSSEACCFPDFKFYKLLRGLLKNLCHLLWLLSTEQQE